MVSVLNKMRENIGVIILINADKAIFSLLYDERDINQSASKYR